MAIEITIPRLGWSMDEGIFGRWLKRDGDYVNEGDALFELEGDKAVQQVESFDSGILRIAPDGPVPGDIVTVGQSLGYLCKQGEQSPFDAVPPKGTQSDATSGPAIVAEQNPNRTQAAAKSSLTDEGHAATAETQGGPPGPIATPSARRLARELGVDLNQLAVADAGGKLAADDVRRSSSECPAPTHSSAAQSKRPARVSPRAARAAATYGVTLADVVSTGSSGRIRERDVLAVVAQRESAVHPRPDTQLPTPDIAPPTPPISLRQTIATRMLAAAQQSAAVTLTASVDATSLVNLRKSHKAGAVDPSALVPSYTDLLVKLSAAALERHPALLGQWSEQGIVIPDGIHVAVAVDTPFGLLTPVLRDVPARSLLDVSEQLARLIALARTRRLTPDELRGGTFTVTNLGAYRVDAFTPLLNLPQSAILGVGRISPQPVVIDGRVEVRDRMTLSLTFDHRVVDGAAAAALLTTICELVESPLTVPSG